MEQPTAIRSAPTHPPDSSVPTHPSVLMHHSMPVRRSAPTHPPAPMHRSALTHPGRPASPAGVARGGRPAGRRSAAVYLWRRAVVLVALGCLVWLVLWGTFRLGAFFGAHLVAPAVGTAPVPTAGEVQGES